MFSSTPGISPLEEATRALLAVWHRARRTVAGHLSPVQLDAMEVVADLPGITLGELAEELHTLPSSASRLCDRLESASLLKRAPALADRRQIALHLTPDGADLLNELHQRRNSDIQAVLEHLTAVERAQLQHGLNAFARHAHRAAQPYSHEPVSAPLRRLPQPDA
ncbi:MarR family winged helix-turn-helix transcriptional regulator [Actinomadura napierensis]|uniref:MarR family transcriptional regulator n=1 Tax=Actinomadura napierensis TaxID=267854 RepID=A0ABP5K4I6_9ACTN